MLSPSESRLTPAHPRAEQHPRFTAAARCFGQYFSFPGITFAPRKRSESPPPTWFPIDGQETTGGPFLPCDKTHPFEGWDRGNFSLHYDRDPGRDTFPATTYQSNRWVADRPRPLPASAIICPRPRRFASPLMSTSATSEISRHCALQRSFAVGSVPAPRGI